MNSLVEERRMGWLSSWAYESDGRRLFYLNDQGIHFPTKRYLNWGAPDAAGYIHVEPYFFDFSSDGLLSQDGIFHCITGRCAIQALKGIDNWKEIVRRRASVTDEINEALHQALQVTTKEFEYRSIRYNKDGFEEKVAQSVGSRLRALVPYSLLSISMSASSDMDVDGSFEAADKEPLIDKTMEPVRDLEDQQEEREMARQLRSLERQSRFRLAQKRIAHAENRAQIELDAAENALLADISHGANVTKIGYDKREFDLNSALAESKLELQLKGEREVALSQILIEDEKRTSFVAYLKALKDEDLEMLDILKAEDRELFVELQKITAEVEKAGIRQDGRLQKAEGARDALYHCVTAYAGNTSNFNFKTIEDRRDDEEPNEDSAE